MKTHLHNNMKKFFVLGMLVIMVMTCPQHTYAQNNVGINNTTPDPSAALDAQSGIGISQGILFPKVNLTTLAFPFPGSGPATHLLVTNTSSTFGRGIGIYRNSGTAGTPVWKKLMEDGDGWSIFGNTGITNPASPANYGTSTIGTTENWLGTTDNRDIVFGTNNIERLRLYNTTGVFSIGAPQTFGRTTITGNTSCALTLWGYNSASNTPNDLYFRRSSGVLGVNGTVTTTGTVLGQIWFQGAGAGTTYEPGARIRVETFATSGAGDMPTQVVISSSPDGSNILKDRMVIKAASNNTSEIWCNLPSPYPGDVFSATSDQNADYAVNGYNTLTTATTGGGIYGESRSATTYGVWGFNSNTAGTGTVGSGQNQAASYLVAGQGGAFTGNTIGLYSHYNSGGVAQAIYTDDNYGNVVRVNYWNGTTQYKILGTGTVSTTAEDTHGNRVVLHAPETPEIYFQDYGNSKLVNGKVHVELDPIITKNITVNAKHPLQVFIQLNGDCRGVFVSNRTATGFDVTELQNGNSNVEFTWSITANRSDEDLGNGKISKNADVRFEKAPIDEPVSEVTKKNAIKNPKSKKGFKFKKQH